MALNCGTAAHTVVKFRTHYRDTATGKRAGLCTELGVYHREMFGLGYHAFLDTKNSDSYYGVTASFGTNYPWVSPIKDLFLTLAISRNTRYRKHNLTYGLECKHILAAY